MLNNACNNVDTQPEIVTGYEALMRQGSNLYEKPDSDTLL